MDIVRLLLASGFNINYPDILSIRPLYFACGDMWRDYIDSPKHLAFLREFLQIEGLEVDANNGDYTSSQGGTALNKVIRGIFVIFISQLHCCLSYLLRV